MSVSLIRSTSFIPSRKTRVFDEKPALYPRARENENSPWKIFSFESNGVQNGRTSCTDRYFRIYLPHFFSPKELKTVRKTMRDKNREPPYAIRLKGPNVLSRVSISGFRAVGRVRKMPGNRK